jgi:hypothetical protein
VRGCLQQQQQQQQQCSSVSHSQNSIFIESVNNDCQCRGDFGKMQWQWQSKACKLQQFELVADTAS